MHLTTTNNVQTFNVKLKDEGDADAVVRDIADAYRADGMEVLESGWEPYLWVDTDGVDGLEGEADSLLRMAIGCAVDAGFTPAHPDVLEDIDGAVKGMKERAKERKSMMVRKQEDQFVKRSLKNKDEFQELYSKIGRGRAAIERYQDWICIHVIVSGDEEWRDRTGVRSRLSNGVLPHDPRIVQFESESKRKQSLQNEMVREMRSKCPELIELVRVGMPCRVDDSYYSVEGAVRERYVGDDFQKEEV